MKTNARDRSSEQGFRAGCASTPGPLGESSRADHTQLGQIADPLGVGDEGEPTGAHESTREQESGHGGQTDPLEDRDAESRHRDQDQELGKQIPLMQDVLPPAEVGDPDAPGGVPGGGSRRDETHGCREVTKGRKKASSFSTREGKRPAARPSPSRALSRSLCGFGPFPKGACPAPEGPGAFPKARWLIR